MGFSRFNDVTANELVAALSAVKGVSARVVSPNAADDFIAVSAILAGRSGRTVKADYAWATTPSTVTTAESVVSHLRELLSADEQTAKTMRRFRRTEKGNK